MALEKEISQQEIIRNGIKISHCDISAKTSREGIVKKT